MIAIVWQFEVVPGGEVAFEELFGADGRWTALNRANRSYLGSSFLRDQTRTSRYLVIEYWSEMLVHEQHKIPQRQRIEDFVAGGRALITSVETLGVFTALDVPDRAGPTWSRRS